MIDTSQVSFLGLDQIIVLLILNIKQTFIIHDQTP